ncbi:MAG: hypothetical protein LC803_03375 [Acidobacteria bacterium]|nr:hypothetical protein [Acidobacteriota bacterium]
MNRARILIAFAVVFTTAFFAYYASAAWQHRGRQAQNAFAIEAGFSKEKALYVPVSGEGGKRLFAIIPTPASQLVQGAADQVSGVKIITHAEGNSVRIDVSTLFGNIDKVTPCNIAEIRQQFVASYRLNLGDEISVAELKNHGLEPLGIKLVRAEPAKVAAAKAGSKHHAVVGQQDLPAEGGPRCCKCVSDGIACCPNVGDCLTCGSCGYCCGIATP